LSIGGVTTGFVVDCRRLPVEGPHHAILAEHSKRGTACATDDLVDAILLAAEQVDKDFPGARLGVGNLGRVGGGEIPWSISHHSGRDVDLGFYLLGADGKPFLPGTLVKLDRQGNGQVDDVSVRFDPARNWRLVRSLLDNPAVSVQWLFVSRSLKRVLLGYAKKKKESPDLLRRAEEVLVQPARARPHNDHMHLRIACSRDDILEGCRDTGSQRSWFKDPFDAVTGRVSELLALARSRDVRTRADAVTVLGRIGTVEGRHEVLMRLNDADVDVRHAAADALVEGGVGGIEDELVSRLGREADEVMAATILQALDRHVSRWKLPALLRSLLALQRRYRVNLGLFEVRREISDWAIDALGRLPLGGAVRLVIEAMEEGKLPADRAAAALRDWTGADPDSSASSPAEAAAAWRGWWKGNRDKSPHEWWAEALRRRGLDASDAAGASAWIKRGQNSGVVTKKWFTEAVGAVLGVRLSRFDIEPLEVLLIRAATISDVDGSEVGEQDSTSTGRTHLGCAGDSGSDPGCTGLEVSDDTVKSGVVTGVSASELQSD
jgi:penicillin-insensitive murein endopeptidase